MENLKVFHRYHPDLILCLMRLYSNVFKDITCQWRDCRETSLHVAINKRVGHSVMRITELPLASGTKRHEVAVGGGVDTENHPCPY